MLKQVVLRTDFSVDLKLLSVNKRFSSKVERKKVKFFLARRQVKRVVKRPLLYLIFMATPKLNKNRCFHMVTVRMG